METISVGGDEMKSYGRIAYEAYCEESIEHKDEWVFMEQGERDAWEAAAQAAIEEYQERKDEET